MAINSLKMAALSLGILMIAGCAATGEENRANVYKAGQANQAQEAKVIKILAVLPAKIEIDNSAQKKNAQVAGALIGALLGASASRNTTSSDKKAAEVLGGAAAGAGAGSLVSDKVLVEGVSLTYIYNEKTLNSVQVGKACEYAPGDAVMVSTTATETRIQPNTQCPKENKSK